MNNHVIRNTILKYVISFAIMTGILFIILASRKVFSGEVSSVNVYRYLTDGFTLPGILFILIGILVWLTNQGSLSSLAWIFKRVIRALIPFGNTKNNQTYKEYLETRKPVAGYSFLFISGIIFFAIGMVFLIIFYSNYNLV